MLIIMEGFAYIQAITLDVDIFHFQTYCYIRGVDPGCQKAHPYKKMSLKNVIYGICTVCLGLILLRYNFFFY